MDIEKLDLEVAAIGKKKQSVDGHANSMGKALEIPTGNLVTARGPNP